MNLHWAKAEYERVGVKMWQALARYVKNPIGINLTIEPKGDGATVCLACSEMVGGIKHSFAVRDYMPHGMFDDRETCDAIAEVLVLCLQHSVTGTLARLALVGHLTGQRKADEDCQGK